MSGFVFYRGPSEIDGAPIIAIATLESRNRANGEMVQTWIMRDDQHPIPYRVMPCCERWRTRKPRYRMPWPRRGTRHEQTSERDVV